MDIPPKNNNEDEILLSPTKSYSQNTPTSRTLGTAKESNNGKMTREGGFPRHAVVIAALDTGCFLFRRQQQQRKAEV